MAKHKELQPLIEEIKTVELNLQIKQQRLAELSREKVSESTVAWKVLIWQRAEQIHKEVEDSQKRQLERERSIAQTQESISDLQKIIDEFTGSAMNATKHYLQTMKRIRQSCSRIWMRKSHSQEIGK